MPRLIRAPRGMRGFSLIEVMLAALLICIGILGMLAVQARTQQNGQHSSEHASAAALASELMELMRARSSATDPKVADGFLKRDGETASPASEAACKTSSIEPRAQLTCWLLRAQQALPGVDDALLSSDFHVCRSDRAKGCSGQGSAVEIQLAWRVRPGECLDGANSSICHYVLRSQL